MREPHTRLQTGFSLSAWLTVAAAALGSVPAVHAQQGLVVLLPGGTDSDQDARWRARITRQHEATGPRVTAFEALPEALSLTAQTVARNDVERLSEVELHLIRARSHAAQLAEREALAELLAAEQGLTTLLHVPGTSAFLVEVQTALGLVAAQAGMNALAEASFRRAAVIDPSRGVRAAETTPMWLERAAAIAREVAIAAVGEVQVTTDPVGARVYLDETLQGTAPLTLRASRGVHVLRIEAEGRRALGMFLPVDAGTRPTVHARLDPDPVTAALDLLSHAAGDADLGSVRAALGRLHQLGAPIDAAWMCRSSELRPERALLVRCTSTECDPYQRLELDPTGAEPDRYGQTLDPAGLRSLRDGDRNARDLAWLNRLEPIVAGPVIGREPDRWWQRWYVWTAAAVGAGAVTAVGIAASQGDETRRLRVTIEP